MGEVEREAPVLRASEVELPVWLMTGLAAPDDQGLSKGLSKPPAATQPTLSQSRWQTAPLHGTLKGDVAAEGEAEGEAT